MFTPYQHRPNQAPVPSSVCGCLRTVRKRFELTNRPNRKAANVSPGFIPRLWVACLPSSFACSPFLCRTAGVKLAQVAGRLLPFAGAGRGGFKHSRSVLADRVGACGVVRAYDAETRCIALAAAMPPAAC